MLLRLAWRNIWRNRRRSVIVLISVVIGLAAVMLEETFTEGMIRQMLDNQINTHVSHVQIHRAGFNDNRLVQSLVPDPVRVEQAISETPEISRWAKRAVGFGLISSAGTSSGAMIIGVEERERDITTVSGDVVEGSYLTGESREILIGRKLATKLDVGIGDRLVLMASTQDGPVGSELFRVSGIFESFSSEFEKSYIYVPLADAQRLFHIGEGVHEYVLRLDDISRADSVAARLGTVLGDGTEVLSYRRILPLLVGQMELYSGMMFILYVIIGSAMIFGIINTMLMSVFERIPEFGVLLAGGMGTGKLFLMVLLEALLLGIVGTVFGMALGLAVHARLAAVGIDLRMFAEGMTSWGIGTVIYPVLKASMITRQVLFIPILCVLAAIYPAVKALRLQPVRAIQHV